MSENSGKQSFHQAVTAFKPEHAELLIAAIDQQAGLSLEEAVPIKNLAEPARQFSYSRNLAEEAETAKTTIRSLLEGSKAVQIARGDLSSGNITDEQFAALEDRPKQAKQMVRALKDMGVFVDNVHHCIGLDINPTRRKPRETENADIQRAATTLLISSTYSEDAQAYYASAANERAMQQPSASMAR